ncbi:MAG: peptide/nickel transport system ATP-binding protein [Solirubrobacteraceae bacterium]|nr:peptide/nickel transport system ATP-binding protein [Solirubrobacteraceae bacterium]
MTATAPDDAPLLEVSGLFKRFPIAGSDKAVHACDDVSIDVRRGETLGLIGESGSGKTTLGRCLLRLIEPTSGEILFDGQDVVRLDKRSLRRLRKDLQIVFQEPYDSLNPQLTIGFQIGEPLRIHTKLSADERKQRVRELLELVGLPRTVAESLPGALSLGTIQRCSIARAVATEPKLIVLDEPTSALSPEAEAGVIKLLKDLQEQLGLAYLFISHDLSLISEICDRVAVMYLSQVVEMGTREEIFAHPRHPYTRALLAAALVPDPRRRRSDEARAERLHGEIPSPIDLPQGCYLASRCPYVRDRCRTEPQVLRPVEGDAGHRARCWRVVEGDLTAAEIEAARARALAEERARAHDVEIAVEATAEDAPA